LTGDIAEFEKAGKVSQTSSTDMKVVKKLGRVG